MERAKKFGTFGGVFTPALLTIISVIMYLRLGWIVGQVGLYYTLLIIFLANVISITTGLSISSIATDKKIKTGGVYYMLSRSLGLSIGGTIGATMFVGFSLSISLNLIGFSESFLSTDFIIGHLDYIPEEHAIRIISVLALVILTSVAIISTSFAIKTQYLILLFIFVSLVSIGFGLFHNNLFLPEDPAILPIENIPPLSTLFAIYFPAVTGFMMGASMSGDLKDPKKSIPKGTMLAILTGMLINVLLAISFAFFINRDLLIEDQGFITTIVRFPALVYAGIWGATLSTALGAIMAGPRVLQAMAIDRLVPTFFKKGYGINNEPHRAIFLIFFIAFCGILIGDLNSIARIATMFFITAYGFTNLAFALESWASTDFRPSFRVPRWVGWLGFMASFLVMTQIDFMAMIVAFMLLWLLWFVMKKRQQNLEPGDVWQSVWTSIVRQSIQKLYTRGIEERNWKPNIMLFTGNPDTRAFLIELGKALIASHGLLSIINLKIRNKESTPTDELNTEQQNEKVSGRGVFLREFFCDDFYQGIENTSQMYGFAGVEPNTVLMGWARKTSDARRYVQMISDIIKQDKNLLLMDFDDERGFGKRGTIDIWWRGSGSNGNLAIKLVKFLWLSEKWKDSQLRLMIENPVNSEQETIFNFATEVLDNLRVNARVVIINNEIEKKAFYDIIRIESAQSDIVFVGLPTIETGKELEFFNETRQLCNDIGTVVLVKASTQFKMLNIGLRHGVQPVRVVAPEHSPYHESNVTLTLPRQEKLAAFATDLTIKTRQIQTEMVEKGFGKILDEFSAILNTARARAGTTFTVIEKRLPENPDDNEATLTAFYKLSQNTFTRYRQILSNIQNNLSAGYARRLTTVIQTFDRENRSFTSLLPETVKIQISRAHLETEKRMSLANRRLLLRMKLLGMKEAEVTIQTGKIIRHFYPEAGHQLKMQLWRSFQVISQQYLEEQQKAFRTFRDNLQILENALTDHTLTPELIDEQRKNSDAAFDQLANFLAKARNQLSHQILEENNQILVQIIRILDTANPNSAFRKERQSLKMRRYLIREMDSFPVAWQDVQDLILNRNQLELILSEANYRLWHFTNQSTYDFRQLWIDPATKATFQIPAMLIKKLDTISQKLQNGQSIAPDDLHIDAVINLRPQLKELEDTAMERTSSILTRLPLKAELLKTGASADFISNHLARPETQVVEASRLLHFIIQNNLIVPLQVEIKKLSDKVKIIEKELGEIQRLIQITLTLDQEEPLQMSLEDFLATQKHRLEKLQENIYSMLITTEDSIKGIFNKASHQLNLSVFLKTAENMRFLGKVREKRPGRELPIYRWAENIQNMMRRNLVKLWYDRSKRIVYAHKANTGGRLSGTSFNDIFAIYEAVTIKEPVLKSLPPYYQQLFLRKNNYLMDFWYGREEEAALALKIINRHDAGQSGAMMITGEYNSGKTFLINYIIHNYLPKRPVYHIYAPFGGSASESEFIRAVQRALTGGESPVGSLKDLPDRSVIVIEDLELWWEKTGKGLKVLNMIAQLIAKYGKQALFIVSANVHAFRSIDRLVNFSSFLHGNIGCQPFHAEELKNIVLQRHQAGNMQMIYNDKLETEMRSWDYAKLFNSFYNCTRGNVGFTMQIWMAGIEKADNDVITIKTPRRPDTSILYSLPPDMMVYMVQFILHKRVSVEKMQRIMQQSPEMVTDQLRVLKRMSLTIEPVQGVFILNPNIHAFIREVLLEKELI